MLGRSLKMLGCQCIDSFRALDFSVPTDYDHSRKKSLHRGGHVLPNGKGKDVKQTSRRVKQGSQKTYLGCMGSGFGSQTPAIYVGPISFTHVHTCDMIVSDLDMTPSFLLNKQTCSWPGSGTPKEKAKLNSICPARLPPC